LNAPWGLASTQEKFGKFENALFVGNFGDGRINVYNLKTGAPLGNLRTLMTDRLPSTACGPSRSPAGRYSSPPESRTKSTGSLASSVAQSTTIKAKTETMTMIEVVGTGAVKTAIKRTISQVA